MPEPFVAEIRIFPFNFAPRDWAPCDGQELPIRENTALFSLVGTYYGGDGKSTFALPDLQGRAVMHAGQGPGLSPRELGEADGSATVALQQGQMPEHSHAFRGTNTTGDNPMPGGNIVARPGNTNIYRQSPGADLVAMAPEALQPAGAGRQHENMQPYLTLSFCTALLGIFPPRPEAAVPEADPVEAGEHAGFPGAGDPSREHMVVRSAGAGTEEAG